MARSGGLLGAPPEATAAASGRLGHGRRRHLVAWLAVVMAAVVLSALVATLSPDDRPTIPHTPPGRPWTATAPLRTTGYWLAEFDRRWARDRARAERLSRSPDSWDHYPLAYSLDALTAAYAASGRTAYADTALRLVANVRASARRSSTLPGSQFRDGYLGWASQRADVRGQEVPLFESYFWRYAAALLDLAAHDPDLLADPARRALVADLGGFAQHDVLDKWLDRGRDDYVFRSRTHMTAHWAQVALHLARVTDDPVRRAQYEDVVREADGDTPERRTGLRQQLIVRPGSRGWFWSDVWGATTGAGQDVAHGNGVLSYVVSAHDLGSGWSDRDLRRFVYTLDESVWPSRGRTAEYVDGSGSGTGWFSDGFVKLGRYAPGLQQRLDSHRPANAQYAANMALNAALLGCVNAASRQPGAQPPACRGRSAGTSLATARR